MSQIRIRDALNQVSFIAEDSPNLCGFIGGETAQFQIRPLKKGIEEILERKEFSNKELSKDDLLFLIDGLQTITLAQQELAQGTLKKKFNPKNSDIVLKISKSLGQLHKIISEDLVIPSLT